MNVSIMSIDELIKYTKPVTELENALIDKAADVIADNARDQEKIEELQQTIEELNIKLKHRDDLIKDWIFEHETILKLMRDNQNAPEWLCDCMDRIEYDYKNADIA